jgi:hypothetical protein
VVSMTEQKNGASPMDVIKRDLGGLTVLTPEMYCNQTAMDLHTSAVFLIAKSLW